MNNKQKKKNIKINSEKNNMRGLKSFVQKCTDIIKNNRKTFIITLAIILVIIIAAVTTVSVCVIKRNTTKKNIEELVVIADNTTIEETQTETQETTEETSEETEAEEEVEEEEIEEFFENEISTEDQEALELPTRRMYAEVTPYDGKKREISYFGDSMVFGIGNTSVEAVVNGKNITGWSSPRTIQHLTGITTYNFGVPGETSYEIAYRAGGVKLYTDRAVTISEDQAATVRLIDDNGNAFTSEDYSGYGYENNSYPNTMYINGYLCLVNNIGGDEVSIKLVRGYAAYNMEITVDVPAAVALTNDVQQPENNEKSVIQPVYMDIDTYENAQNNGILLAEYDMDLTEQVTDSTIQQATQPTQEATKEAVTNPTQSTQPETKEPEANPTQPVTAIPTQPATEAPTQPPLIGNVDIPEGAEAIPKAAKDHSQNDILILEIGSNGGWGSDYQTLILQYDDIILNSGCEYYIIVGDTDDPGTSIGDYNQGEYNDDGSYIGIGDTSWEAALREAYGDHFFNTRTYIIQNGLSICGLKTTTQDLENFKKGNISKQMRYDWTHFNAYGYYAKGVGIYEKGRELGYWS